MMKTTIKQAEPYSAPAVKVLAFEAGKTIMQTSVGGNSINNMEEEEITW